MPPGCRAAPLGAEGLAIYSTLSAARARSKLLAAVGTFLACKPAPPCTCRLAKRHSMWASLSAREARGGLEQPRCGCAVWTCHTASPESLRWPARKPAHPSGRLRAGRPDVARCVTNRLAALPGGGRRSARRLHSAAAGAGPPHAAACGAWPQRAQAATDASGSSGRGDEPRFSGPRG